jgi:hypothetical protein
MELVESFTHFDTKVLATFKDLIVQPGLVIKNFNDNKRARYVPPIRIYAFTSFAFFLILSFTANKKVDKELEIMTKDIQKASTGLLRMEILGQNIKIDSLTNRELFAHPSLTNELIDSTLRSKKIETNWVSTRSLYTVIKIGKGELTLADLYKKFIRSSSYAIFVFMPIFALLMIPLYRKRNYFYSEFLVFSIYFHTFLFSIFGVLVILFRFINVDFEIIATLLLLGMVVYLGLSLKRVFADSIPKTVIKTVLLSLTYSFLLLFSIRALFFISM